MFEELFAKGMLPSEAFPSCTSSKVSGFEELVKKANPAPKAELSIKDLHKNPTSGDH